MLEWGVCIYSSTSATGARGVIDEDALSRMTIFQTSVGCPGSNCPLVSSDAFLTRAQVADNVFPRRKAASISHVAGRRSARKIGVEKAAGLTSVRFAKVP